MKLNIKKIFTIAFSTILLISGIIFFKAGHILLKDFSNKKLLISNEKEFWVLPISIFGVVVDEELTPELLFNTIPSMDIYPDDKIIYFKFLNLRESESNMIISGSIIQNNKTLYINQYYFDTSNGVELKKIKSEEIITGLTSEISEEEELRSLIKVYKGFIDLWVIRSKES